MGEMLESKEMRSRSNGRRSMDIRRSIRRTEDNECNMPEPIGAVSLNLAPSYVQTQRAAKRLSITPSWVEKRSNLECITVLQQHLT